MRTRHKDNPKFRCQWRVLTLFLQFNNSILHFIQMNPNYVPNTFATMLEELNATRSATREKSLTFTKRLADTSLLRGDLQETIHLLPAKSVDLPAVRFQGRLAQWQRIRENTTLRRRWHLLSAISRRPGLSVCWLSLHQRYGAFLEHNTPHPLALTIMAWSSSYTELLHTIATPTSLSRFPWSQGELMRFMFFS